MSYQRYDGRDKPSSAILNLPLHVRALMALRDAFAGVVEEALHDERSIHIWRDDKVAEVSGEELRKLVADFLPEQEAFRLQCESLARQIPNLSEEQAAAAVEKFFEDLQRP